VREVIVTGYKLPVRVPPTRSAWYLIGTGITGEEALDCATRWIDENAPRWIGERVRALTGTQALAVTSVAATDVPYLTPDQRELIGKAERWVSVRVELPTAPGLEHERLARRVAFSLADEFRAEAVDMVSGAGVTAEMLESSLHAKEEGVLRLADWISVEFRNAGAGGITVSTSGLRRYGLPEVTAGQVPARLARSWGIVLTGLAFQVSEVFAGYLGVAMRRSGAAPPDGWKAPRTIRLPEEIEVLTDDVRAAYCLPGGFASRRWGWRYGMEYQTRDVLRLSLVSSTTSVLRVLPPRGWDVPDVRMDEFAELFLADDHLRSAIIEAAPFAREHQEVWRPRDARYEWQDLLLEDSLAGV
jgi:hypothetical protein